MSGSLDALLSPESVAIIGASNSPGRIGGRPINSLIQSGFKGKIYPVNPKYSEVQGLPAFSSITEVPGPVDCAIIAVPVVDVVETMRACADAGVRSAVVFTSGLAESSERGAELQKQLTAIARDSGMRMVGPNCLGVAVPGRGWYGTFASYPSMGLMRSGSLGIISQSGAYGSHLYMVAQSRGLGVCYWVTTGNEGDVDVAEVIEYYAGRPEVKVIVAYAEGVRDMRAMKQALGSAHAARKLVIFMKVADRPSAPPLPLRTPHRWRAPMRSMAPCSRSTASTGRSPPKRCWTSRTPASSASFRKAGESVCRAFPAASAC